MLARLALPVLVATSLCLGQDRVPATGEMQISWTALSEVLQRAQPRPPIRVQLRSGDQIKGRSLQISDSQLLIGRGWWLKGAVVPAGDVLGVEFTRETSKRSGQTLGCLVGIPAGIAVGLVSVGIVMAAGGPQPLSWISAGGTFAAVVRALCKRGARHDRQSVKVVVVDAPSRHSPPSGPVN